MQSVGARQEEFSNHECSSVPSAAWRVARPGTSTGSFIITWSPGALHLHGDWYKLAVEHPSMDSVESAIDWVRGAEYEYFMEKSDVPRDHFQPEKTVEELIERIESFLAEDGGHPTASSSLRALNALFGYCADSDLASPNYRAKLFDEARRNARRFGMEDYYVALIRAGDQEPAIVLDYPERTRVQFEAFKVWASKMPNNAPHQKPRPSASI